MTTFPLSEVLALAHLPALIGSKRGKMQDALDAHALAMLPELVAALEDLIDHCDANPEPCLDNARAILAKANQVPLP